jgi:trigger factor
MQVAVADAAECQKDLTIEVPAEEVQQEFKKSYDAYARHVKVPGFRPGRVPLAVVKQRFAKDVKDEVIGHLVPHALGHAITDHKLRVVGEPQIKADDISCREGEPLRFTASVTVLPEVKLKDYKGIKVTKRIAKITDENVDHVIEQMRQNAAQLVPVEDRPAQAGDIVSVNLVGKYVIATEAHEHEDLKADDVQIELGAEGVQPEFDENLRGTRSGDVREFRVSYPADFSSKGLAGKTVDFTATVVAVRQKELPELDDDFAQEAGEYESLQDMRDKVRAELESVAQEEADAMLRDELIGTLISQYDFPLPQVLVDKQADQRLADFINRLLRSGMPPSAAKQIDWKARQEEDRQRAARDVRAALLMEEIAEAEKLEVTRDDMEAEINKIAEGTKLSVDEVKARLTKEDGLSSIHNRLRYEKTLDFLVKNADITVEEFTEKPASDTGETPAAEASSEGESAAPAAE